MFWNKALGLSIQRQLVFLVLPMLVQCNSRLAREPESPPLMTEAEIEAYAEDFDLQIEESESVLELYATLQNEAAFQALSRSEACKVAISLWRRYKCVKPIDYIESTIKRRNFGQLGIDDKKQFVVKGPASAVLRNEVNRINALIVFLNARSSDICQMARSCATWQLAYHCDGVRDEVTMANVAECDSNVRALSLDNLLAALDDIIEKMGDGDGQYPPEVAITAINSFVDEAEAQIKGEDTKDDSSSPGSADTDPTTGDDTSTEDATDPT